MARNPKATKKTSDRRLRPAGAGGANPRRGRPKFCLFCREHATWVDYKDVGLLKRFVNDRGRIRARGATGTCAQHQRDVATAIKTARELALLPYVVRTTATQARGGRGGEHRGNAQAAPGAGPAADDSGSADATGDYQTDGPDVEESEITLPALT